MAALLRMALRPTLSGLRLFAVAAEASVSRASDRLVSCRLFSATASPWSYVSDGNWKEPLVTKAAPSFKGKAVIGGEFKDISLSDYKGRYLVLFFYPLDFTFVCPTEIIAFNDRLEEFEKLNTNVVACSVDSHFTHLAWTNTPRKEGGLGKLRLPLLSDLTKQISNDYGVLLEDGVSLRGLFIIDGKGFVRQSTINDLPVGRSVDETLRLIEAFQYTDKHGEVCPAGWKPGADTMKPDPEGSKTYFQKQ